MNEITIYTSRKKSVMLLIISALFVIITMWLFIEKNDFFMFFGSLFFTPGLYIFGKRSIKSRMAIRMNSQGIHILTNSPSTVSLDWKQIIGFSEIAMRSNRHTLIFVKESHLYIKKESNIIRQMLMRLNNFFYKTPFSVSASGLNIGSDELNRTIMRFYEKYNNEVQHRV